MAKLSNAKIKYIQKHINGFEALMYINTKKGDAPEVITPTREMVCNIIGACTFLDTKARKLTHNITGIIPLLLLSFFRNRLIKHYGQAV